MFDEKIKELKASINSLSATIADKTAQVKNALEADDLEKARTIKNEIDAAKEELKTAKTKFNFSVNRRIKMLLPKENIKKLFEEE